MRTDRRNLVSVVGARPQFIKVAALTHAISEWNAVHRQSSMDHAVIHTGQHYDPEMSRSFFDEFGLPEPDENLEVGSGSHADQTARTLERVAKVLSVRRPDVVVTYGDTNATIAAALAAAKLNLPVAHVEAGLREYSKTVPEEINRLVTDHLSAFLFCPCERAVRNLEHEGLAATAGEALIPEGWRPDGETPTSDHPWVLNTGDVMVDALKRNLRLAEETSTILPRLDLRPKSFLLATVHRAENTDDPQTLEAVLEGLGRLAQQGHRVVLPLHPRTRAALDRTPRAKAWAQKLTLIPPVSYRDMLRLQSASQLVLTDSGGVQKEAFLLRVPCVNLRTVTSWPETVDAGWNALAGADPGAILAATEAFLATPPTEPKTDPYGDGRAAERIVGLLCKT